MTFSDNQRSIAGGKISLNVSRRLVSGASVIKCCYAATDIGISSTVGENVDLLNTNMTLIDFKKGHRRREDLP
jgi:hypothetical protein